MGDVRRDGAVADLDRRSVEADVGDVVLPTAVGAAAHLHVDPPRELIVDLHLDEPLVDSFVQPHRTRDPELAGIGARAADDIGDLISASASKFERPKALPHLVDRSVANPAQNQILMNGRSSVDAGVLPHDLRQPAELLRGQVAARNLDLDRREAALALRTDVGFQKPLELTGVAVRGGECLRLGGRVHLLVVLEQDLVEREVTL